MHHIWFPKGPTVLRNRHVFGDKNNFKGSGEGQVKSDIKTTFGKAVENKIKVIEGCDIENEGDDEDGDNVIVIQSNETCVGVNESSANPMQQNLETDGGEYNDQNIGDDEFIIE